ncbi:MAG: Crp/Fnr family transcriptional regulator [Flavobacterium sp.]|uniref:Crp/Fnr family transcriptional regulator n=1 Tax=Flavobacterium sp. TaxID=239 RepID=UPI000C4B4242|nr:Crp/Fnr family transcriptional regulator [Flavobacterium sp.]MBF04657.1 Crp/Fnr family transcriptional regulator [Flavobacterium sp.]|tara:strand:- start:228 stop:812 length:585 start_codon:yes stop_codon:yes gene_type:complete
MKELQVFTDYFRRYIDLNEEEVQLISSVIRIYQVKKRQFIVQPEFICKYRTYVFSGAFRAYLIGNNGHDHTIAFAIEDWWISDYSSYIFQEPATLFVEALEDSVVIQLDYNSEQLLKESHPKFEKFFRIITERSFAFLQKRMLSTLSKSAEERYEDFIKKYPKVANRVPQYALASYLGMTTEFLSKIRNKRVSK